MGLRPERAHRVVRNLLARFVFVGIEYGLYPETTFRGRAPNQIDYRLVTEPTDLRDSF